MPDPDWLAHLTAADFARAGIDAEEPSRVSAVSPATVLADWAGQYDVDLAKVHECLVLLSSGALLLHAGSPLAVMTYSPRRGCFRAAFDGDGSADLIDLRWPAAGAWLTVVAAENGSLPSQPDDWSIVRLAPAGMCGPNRAAVDLYRRYAHLVAVADHLTPLDPHDLLLCRSVWACASYALR